MTGPAIHRRGVLAGMAAGAAVIGGGPALACDPRGARPLAVLDPALAPLAARLAHRMEAELVRVEVGADPMRLWRDRIAPRLDEGAPILGVTGWADYLVLRGSAAESRRRVRLEIGPDGAARRVPGADDPALAALAERFRALADADSGAAERFVWVLA